MSLSARMPRRPDHTETAGDMNLRGLVISGESSKDTSAYSHRLMMLAECLAQRNIPCDFFYPADHPLLNVWTTASVLMCLRLKMLRSYDFVYTGCEEAGQSMFFCRPLLRGPVIYDTHGDLVAQSALMREIESSGVKKNTPLRVRIVSRMAMNCAAHVVTVSKYHAERLIGEGVPSERVSIIRNGVDPDLFSFQPIPKPAEFTFGYAGGFQSYQGMDNLIRAFELLSNPNIRLLVIGFTDKYRDLKQRFADKFGNRVELVDRTDRATLARLLSNVLIPIIPGIDHPGRRNVFPTKFAEFGALGRPILVTNVDETADFVRKYDCGFVSGPSPESMAQAMETAGRVPMDALAEMGRRARKMVEENFSWEKIGDEYAELVQQVVNQYRSARRGRHFL